MYIQCDMRSDNEILTLLNELNNNRNESYNYLSIEKDENNKRIVNCVCKNHGLFQMRVDCRMKGQQCRKCARLKTNEQFIKESQIIDIKKGFKYDYSECNYQGNKNKVILLCSEHGKFKIRGSTKLSGCGCKKCATKKTSEKQKSLLPDILFNISLNDEKDGIDYNYSLIKEYKSTHTKVDIICNKHGIFKMSLHNRLQGNKCKECTHDFCNYKKSDWIEKANEKIGTFYIIRCWNENENFFKFGITFNSIRKRYNHHTFMPYNYEIIREIKSFDLSYIWDLEKRFKIMKRKNKYSPKIHFAGDKYECFKN